MSWHEVDTKSSLGYAEACSILDELNDIGVTAPASARTSMYRLGKSTGC